MKRIMIIVAGIAGLWGSVAFAALDPEPNRIGLYFDLETFEVCSSQTVSYEIVPAFIVLTNPTFSELHGWEASLGVVGDPYLTSVTFAGGGINSGSDWEYSVSLAEPIVCEPVTLLATVNFFSYWNDISCLYMGGVEYPTISGVLPVVWPQAESPVQVEVSQASDNGVAAVLGSCAVLAGHPHVCSTIVGNESVSWDSLKASYK